MISGFRLIEFLFIECLVRNQPKLVTSRLAGSVLVTINGSHCSQKDPWEFFIHMWAAKENTTRYLFYPFYSYSIEYIKKFIQLSAKGKAKRL